MKLLNKLQSLKKNGDFKNVLYSLSSYFVSPIVIIVTTPILLKTLGSSDYGIWVLINSLINVLGISNFGLGNAFIKLGAEYKTLENMFNKLFCVSLTLSIVLAVGINAVTLTMGNTLFPFFFGSSKMDSILPVIHLVGGVVGLRIINSIISGSYMAIQRYDVNSKINIIYNFLTSVIFTVLAVFYKDIKLLVITLFISTIILLIVNSFIAKKINSNISYGFIWNKEIFIKIFKYGIYSWFQLIITTLNSHADKIIVGALLGSNALGYYAVCMQLIIKIHEVPAAASAFLFAKFSSLFEDKQFSEIRKIYKRAFMFISIFIIALSSVAFIFANTILSVWISPEFAYLHTTLFRILVVSVAIGAFGIIPNYCLNGTGYIKTNTVLSLTSSLLTFSLLYFLVSPFGDMALGFSRLASLPLIVFSIYFVNKKIISFRKQSQSDEMIQELPTGVSPRVNN
uniref:oligosaccharide flippase family protein n=1 Tax=Paenibacillus terrae TaxID=159743 RepID=UPI0011A3A4F4|nr:oligosaccharide flippase family protein [Paenibacillus terrae]